MCYALAPRFAAFFCCGVGQPTMKRLVLAAVLHVAATNNCERATDLKPEHICRAPTNPDALRSAIPDAADALPLHAGTPRSLEISPGRVEKQKARLLRKANTEGAPLVWVLDDYVGIGNALDAYVRAVIEARHRGRSRYQVTDPAESVSIVDASLVVQSATSRGPSDRSQAATRESDHCGIIRRSAGAMGSIRRL